MTDTAQLTYSPEPHTILSPSGSFRFAPLTCSIGAELFDVNLGDAARDDALFAELRELLLEYKVLFLRDQDMSRAEHVALAERFGPLEDHPRRGGATPTTRGWCKSTRTSTARPSTTRTPFTATPPGGRTRPWAACSAAWRRPRSAETPSG